MSRLKALQRPGLVLCLLAALLALYGAPAQAQGEMPRTLNGSFSVAYEEYNTVPLVVALSDAHWYFTDAPILLAPPEEQVIGSYIGTSGFGAYSLELPAEPPAAEELPGWPGVRLYDVRLMSDVGGRGHLAVNEDNIASTLHIDIEAQVRGGTLITWAAADGTPFSAGAGADAMWFTADDPTLTLPSGWSLLNLDSVPFRVIREATPTLDLITTGMGATNDYRALPCAELVPTFLDRVERLYPFTALHRIDWPALRARLLPQAEAAATQYDCELLFQQFGSAIPDGHVNYYLPTMEAEYAGSVGIVMVQLTDGQIAVRMLRPSGPAEAAGIRVGALVTAWDGVPILEAMQTVPLRTSNASTPHGLANIQLRELTRGPLGSAASVTFQNPGEAPRTASLTRNAPRPVASTPIPGLSDSRLPSGIGYIRLASFFNISTLREFDATLDRLMALGVPGIMIDVRGNPGGFSQMSDALAGRFFEEDYLVGETYIQERLIFRMQVTPRQPVYTGPVAVLVDLGTSSAGDLFAYTFQASGRAVIVGHTPSGGLAGTVSGGQYDLPGGGFIQVPTGGFVNEAGEVVVEGTGVVPDILVPLTVETLTSADDELVMAAEQALLETVPARP